MDKNIKEFVKQDLSPGITLEKFQQTINDKNYYVMRIEVKSFNEVDFTADFTGSTNIQIENNYGMICNTRIKPYTKTEVARLVLSKGWSLKTSFKCFLNMPSIDFQQEHFGYSIVRHNGDIIKTKGLKFLDATEVNSSLLTNYLEKNSMKFVDHDFLPDYRAIDSDPEYTIINFSCIIDWTRLGLIYYKITDSCHDMDESIINETFNIYDVVQGKIKNSWLLSSMAALTKTPNLLKRLITTGRYNPKGFYLVKFNDMAKWRIYIIDDLIPCIPMGDPFFCHNDCNSVWPYILEKVYAKRYGGYTGLNIGKSRDAFFELTGCPSFEYKLSVDFGVDWETNEMVFDKLNEWNDSHYAITVESKEISSINNSQIVIPHTYTFINIHMSERMIVIYDTLKSGLFNGKYIKDSEVWTEELKISLSPDFASGLLYISFEEFVKYFDTITVCKTRKWHEINLKGKFIIPDNKSKARNECLSRWIYKLTIGKTKDIIIGLHQKYTKNKYWQSVNAYLDTAIAVLSKNNDDFKLVKFIDFTNELNMFYELNLSAGTYYIVPLAVIRNENDSSNDVDLRAELDPELVEVISEDTFEKLDMLNKGYLTITDVNKFMSYIDKTLSEQDINQLLAICTLDGAFKIDINKITLKYFSFIFEDVYRNLTIEERVKLLESLGYSKSLKTIKSRIFGLSLRTKREVQLDIEDGLKSELPLIGLTQSLEFDVVDLKTGTAIDKSIEQVILCGKIHK